MSKLVSYLRDKHALWYKSFLFIVCLIFIVWTLPKQGHFKYEFSKLKGKPWNYENLIAPFDFPINKTTAEFNKEKDEVNKNAHFYFTANDALLRKKINEFDSIKGNKDKLLYSIARPILDSILKRGIIEQIDTLAGKPGDFTILVLSDGIAEEHTLNEYFTLAEADKFIIREAEKIGPA